MKKVCFIFAILLVNSVFTSCTDLDDNLEKESIKLEIFATGGEDGQDPVEEEDPTNED